MSFVYYVYLVDLDVKILNNKIIFFYCVGLYYGIKMRYFGI